MHAKLVAQQEVGTDVSERKIIDGGQPRFVHKQRARTFGDRFPVENNANSVVRRLDHDSVAVMYDRVS
jgi:hypothetical protein